MDRQDRALGVAACCLSAAVVISLLGLLGVERVAAGLLVGVAAVGVTACLALMADGTKL
jgi:hypothetical protein